MKVTGGVEQQLQSYRQEFDASFAEPQAAVAQARQTVLRLQVAGASYAVCIAELAGLLACRKLVRLPAAPPSLAGLVGIRGRLFGAFDLGQLLGYPSRTASFRWLLLCPGAEPIALCVESIEAYLEAAESEFLPLPARSGGHISRVLRQGDLTLPVLQIPSLVAAIQALAHNLGTLPMES